MTDYINLSPITMVQKNIMKYIDYWVCIENTPISQKRILDEMEERHQNRKTIIHALDGLLKNGYIRRAITNAGGEDGKGSEKTKYVKLRGV